MNVVGPSHIFQVGIPPLQLRDFLLQFRDEAFGPPLRLPLLLLDSQNQLSLSPLDGAHKLRENLNAFIDLSLSTGLKGPAKYRDLCLIIVWEM